MKSLSPSVLSIGQAQWYLGTSGEVIEILNIHVYVQCHIITAPRTHGKMGIMAFH